MYAKNATGKAVSMPLGLSIGLLYSILVLAAGIAVSAKLIESEIMEQAHMGYGILVTLMASAWIGAMAASHKIKRRRLAVCMLSGILLLGTLLAANALLFGGNYRGVGESGMLILCGSTLAVFSDLQKKGRKRKVYNR